MTGYRYGAISTANPFPPAGRQLISSERIVRKSMNDIISSNGTELTHANTSRTIFENRQ
jgi:hypothetical protein